MKLYHIPSINFLLFWSEIVFISWGLKYFTSNDISFFISSLPSVDIFFFRTTFFNTHMHKTIRLTIRYWSILVIFRGIWEFWRFYGILHKNWQCGSDVIIARSDTSQIFTSELYFISLSWCLRLVQFSDVLSLYSSQNHPHFVWQTHFCQFLGLLPSDLASNRLAND